MEEPGWKMMGDKFQPGPFTDVIVGVRQRVTQEYKLFLEGFSGAVQRRPGWQDQALLPVDQPLRRADNCLVTGHRSKARNI
ncbi:hypothetical protein ABIA52_003614 [Paenarthrobacter histidinolovorans]|uniref:Uncharacterized protein n=1 Tax=Paenarthrobacter histidinolovorans TaxID=43664 RepID=A0ABW8NAX2_9MICC